MQANVFRGPGEFGLEEKPIPTAGTGEAVIQVKLTTICGTDIHIVRGEYPVAEGLTLGHEAVGVIHELGAGVTGYSVGQRVLVGAITPCGQCEACLRGDRSQCGGPLGGWRLGNTIDGVQAEYALIPNAQANLAVIPEALSDEQVILLADIASTGFAAAERGKVRLGDTVAVFAQGPIGLCATLGARLMGASEIIAVDSDPSRLKMAQRFGATAVVLAEGDPLEEIREVTEGRGVDVAIEALGTQETFRERLARSSARRDVVERRRLFRTPDSAARCGARRPGRPNDCDHSLSWGQGAHAAVDAAGAGASHRFDAAVDARSIRSRRSRKPTSCSNRTSAVC